MPANTIGFHVKNGRDILIASTITDSRFSSINRTSLAQKFITLITLALLLVSVSANAQQTPLQPLRMALIPYLSPNVLVPLFQPLAKHFEKDMGRPVELYSAPNIRTHIERILKPDYDIIFTAPHMGRLSQLDADYVPIGSFELPLTGVITVKKDGPVKSVAQLKGRTVAINDRLVLNSILTLQELEKRGVGLADMNIVAAASQNSAILSVVAGDVDAAITVNFALGQVPKNQLERVHVLFQTDPTPSMPSTLILVHPSMSPQDRSRLENSLQEFARTVEGKQFLVSSSYKNVVPINPAHLTNLDIYLPELRRLLAIKPGS